MRPPATQPSHLKQPFNQILRTETNVRVLRVLCRSEMAVGKAEVARRAELNDSGVRRALETLIDLGVVEPASANVQSVRLRREHPLAGALEGLFAAEAQQFKYFIESLRSVVDDILPPPISAWVDGVEDYDPRQPSTLRVSVVARADQAEMADRELRAALADVLRQSDVRIEPRVLTRADLVTRGRASFTDDCVLLMAPHPADLLEGSGGLEPPAAHGVHDRRQRRIAAVIAEWLLDEPELIERARRALLERVSSTTSPKDPNMEWLRLLEDKPVGYLRQLLLDPGEEATRLRQSMPFVAALSTAERERLRNRIDDDAD